MTLFAAAREGLARARWLEGAEVLVADDLELDPVEAEFVAALAAALPVRVLRRALPPSLRPASFRGRLAARGVAEVDWSDTPLAPLAPPPPPASLAAPARGPLRGEPRGRARGDDGAVELVTAPGEAAEVRAIARRLLREAARGVSFEEMGVVLPRPETYAPLFTDLLSRLGIPHRLHPSLPLRFGRAARSLLLLFRCRGLERPGGDGVPDLRARAVRASCSAPTCRLAPRAGTRLSREAGHRLRPQPLDPRPARVGRGRARGRRAGERTTTAASGGCATWPTPRRCCASSSSSAGRSTRLAGEATWAEWVERLRTVVDQWIGPERDRDAVLEVIADLGGLGSVAARAPWAEVEQVLEARFEWERLPLEPPEGGAVHVGALDAMAGPALPRGRDPRPRGGGLSGRVPARSLSPGFGARGAPNRGPRRRSRERSPGRRSRDPPALPPRTRAAQVPARPLPPSSLSSRPRKAPSNAGPSGPGPPDTALGSVRRSPRPRTASSRRAASSTARSSQATERLILSYPRADARTGRERLPSLFFAAAASTLAGRPLAGAELERLVVEDDLDRLPLEDAVDAGERDRIRLRRDEARRHRDRRGLGRSSASPASPARPAGRAASPATTASWWARATRTCARGSTRSPRAHPVSASRLATYARCGFLYLLQNVLRLQPAPEPEERRRIDPLERGDLFHRVAERYLRERRDRGQLPVRDTEAARARLAEMAEEALEGLVAGSPPRFTLLWQREKRRFHETVQGWLGREAASAARSTPAHFEVSFGLGKERDEEEPHDPEPLEIDLGDGRSLRVSGRIDRIDRREDGLVLRDYKTGRAPKDDGGVFRGGKQLQIPFYVLAAAKLLPGERVVDAFLDYVDGGRQVAFRPDLAQGPEFRDLLRRLVDLVARGVFVQEPTACDFCDFTAVCGPKALLQRRQAIKVRDRALQEYLRLRDVS